MTISELLLLDFDSQILNTRRTIERLTDDLGDYAPHEKSMKLGKLAMHCASLPLFGLYIMEDEGMDLANSTRPQSDFTWTTVAAALERLDEPAAKCRAAIAASSDEHLTKDWKFTYGEQLISHDSRAKSFRIMCFDHLIHHTAQLGVYLRLNNLAVPGLYGPSADESWAPK